jgi:hypothetical protein
MAIAKVGDINIYYEIHGKGEPRGGEKPPLAFGHLSGGEPIVKPT